MDVYTVQDEMQNIRSVVSIFEAACQSLKELMYQLENDPNLDHLREEDPEDWLSELDFVPLITLWHVDGTWEDTWTFQDREVQEFLNKE